MLKVRPIDGQAPFNSFGEVCDDSLACCHRNATNSFLNCLFQFFQISRLATIGNCFQITPQVKIAGIQVRRMRSPFNCSASTDDSVLELWSEPLKGTIRSVGSSPILHEPLGVHIDMFSFQFDEELLQHAHVTLCVDCRCSVLVVDKPDGANNSLSTDSSPSSTFLRVKGPFENILRWRSPPVKCTLWGNMSRQIKMGFVREPHIVKKVRLTTKTFTEPLAHEHPLPLVLIVQPLLDLQWERLHLQIGMQNSVHTAPRQAKFLTSPSYWFLVIRLDGLEDNSGIFRRCLRFRATGVSCLSRSLSVTIFCAAKHFKLVWPPKDRIFGWTSTQVEEVSKLLLRLQYAACLSVETDTKGLLYVSPRCHGKWRVSWTMKLISL